MKINIPILLNNKLIDINRNLFNINNIIYISILDLCNILQINKSTDINYNNDTKYISINKNNNILLINDSMILFNNNNCSNNGYIKVGGITYMPIKLIVELYNGIYIENENGIYIDL